MSVVDFEPANISWESIRRYLFGFSGYPKLKASYCTIASEIGFVPILSKVDILVLKQTWPLDILTLIRMNSGTFIPLKPSVN